MVWRFWCSGHNKWPLSRWQDAETIWDGKKDKMVWNVFCFLYTLCVGERIGELSLWFGYHHGGIDENKTQICHCFFLQKKLLSEKMRIRNYKHTQAYLNGISKSSLSRCRVLVTLSWIGDSLKPPWRRSRKGFLKGLCVTPLFLLDRLWQNIFQ